MTRMGFIMGAVVLAFVLSTANTSAFANNCCSAKKDAKECNKEAAKDCAKKTSASASSGDKCKVCGQAADCNGKQVDVTHAGETVHLCCEGCAEAYNKNPDKYSKAEKRRDPIKKNERSSAY